MADNLISWGDLKKGMRAVLWPFPGEARNLRTAHDVFFRDAANDLQKWVTCLQQNNVSVIPYCATYIDCGKTLVKAPVGFIKYVYTIAGNDFCDRVYLKSATINEVITWARNRLQVVVPSGTPSIQTGIRLADKSADSNFGRARTGIYAIHNNRLYVTPWLQSNETLVIEWDGIKKDWADDDMVDRDIWDQDVELVIRDFVKWKDQTNFGAPNAQDLSALMGQYDNGRADLIWECHERTKQIDDPFTDEPLRIPTGDEIKDDAVPAAMPLKMNFAVIGDYGFAGNTDSQNVANLVKGWQPEFVVTSGDNSYSGGPTLDEFDADVGSFYQQYIFPYLGKYGPGATRQNFYPTIGNHDRDPNGKGGIFGTYFNIVGPPYYTVRRGPIEFFFLDAGYDNSQVNRNPDGVAFDSVMGKWLQGALARSKAPWKWVFVHQPPYSSTVSTILTAPLAGDGTLSYPALRYPYAAWGANLVSSGHAHNYERLEIEGLPFLINGLGGRPPASFTTPLSYSQVRYNTKNGAQLVSATCTTLDISFYNVDGSLIDTLSLAKSGSVASATPATSPAVPIITGNITYKNVRLKDGTWEIFNKDTGKWVPYYIVGAEGVEQIELETEET